MKVKRCAWVTDDPVYIEYHDKEWGNLDNFDNDHYLFEMLVLEGAQAGLSWITILKRRENYQKAFANFDPKEVAEFGDAEINELLKNKGIIRNKRKINSAIQNAKAFIKVQKEFGSFHQYLWEFTGCKPVENAWIRDEDIPVSSDLSKQLSKDLKKRGFSFVGPVICYSYLQAIGLIQDHLSDCFLNKGRDKTE